MIEKLDWAGYNLTTIVAKINEIIDTLSKPVIKYPKKKEGTIYYTCGEHPGECDMQPGKGCYDCQCAKISKKQEMTEKDKTFNSFIDDMRKLNGEGV